MNDEVLVVLCTFPDQAVAREIGASAVEKQAAACVNLLPGVRSIFSWQGVTEEDAEVLAVLKTTRRAYLRLEALICEAHPYDEPEVIALPVVAGSPGYLSWVAASTGDPESEDG